MNQTLSYIFPASAGSDRMKLIYYRHVSTGFQLPVYPRYLFRTSL